MTTIEALTAAPELPVHLTHFVGRDQELDDLTRLLPSARLLTLTGAGGSGKTRLAREAALRVAGEFGRVGWVDLASIGDADLVAQEIARALHVPERTDATPRDVVIGVICEIRTLLILDNCEHLVDACAEIAEALLRACPRLTILATSREALGVPSETAWLVPPMVGTEAAQLFVERAQATSPNFAITNANNTAITEICRRLDGIPLAIELAAARVRVLSPEQIAQRLDDAFRLLTSGSRTALARHRTLRATMEWSFGLLKAREQVLLRRLSVFAGSFSLDAAEAVCIGDGGNETLDAEDILDGVTALVDKSLVYMTAGDGIARYQLLETVRQYGNERLRDAGGTETIERRHAEYFLDVIEAAAPKLFGGETEPGLLARLAPDNDNFRLAAAWTVRGKGHGEMALRFADAFFWYWYGSAMHFGAGQFGEGRRFIREALDRARTEGCSPALRGRALASRGLIGLAQGDYHDASAAFDESLALLRAEGDTASIALVLAKYGATRLMMGDLEHAWTLVEEAYALAQPLPLGIIHSFVTSWRGWVARARGDMSTARFMHGENLRIGHALQNRTTIGHGHAFLAAVELADNRVDEAFTNFCEALPYHIELGDGWGLALDIEGLSACASLRGRHADAVRLMGAVDALRERSAVALPASDAADRAERTSRLRDKLGDAFDRLYAEGRTLTMDEVVGIATDASVMHTSEFRVPPFIAANPGAETKREGLRVSTLGPLQVSIGGKTVDAAAWGSARPRELLVYLLMHPEGKTKEQVGLAFWPDASAAQVRNNFHVTLHRLRKVLGNSNWVTLVGDRYRIDPDVVDELDVAEFEREVEAARRALVRGGGIDAVATLERALARYRGDFLDGEPVGDWHLEHRDRLQRVYVDALMELGGRYVEEERHSKAAEAFRRVLARDELHEEALRALMRSLAEAGERSQALRAYRAFAARLKEELEAEPEDETLQLSESLQASTT